MAVNWEDIQKKPFETVSKSLTVTSDKSLAWDSDNIVDGPGIELENTSDGRVMISNTDVHEWLPSQAWEGRLMRTFSTMPLFYSLSMLKVPLNTLTGLYSFVQASGFIHILLNGTLRGLYDFLITYGFNSMNKPFISRCTLRTVLEEGDFMTETGRPNIACVDVEEGLLWFALCNNGYKPTDELATPTVDVRALMSNLQCTKPGTMVDFVSLEADRIKPFERAGSERKTISYTTPDYSNDTF